jgi:superfamily I DNA/RNA helicase
LIGNEPRLGERIDVLSLDAIAKRLFERTFGKSAIATEAWVRAAIAEAAAEVGAGKFSASFLHSEWSHVVDAWQLTTWDSYRDVARLGRKTRLPEKQRATLWSLYDAVRRRLVAEKLWTLAAVYARLTEHYAAANARPFQYVVVDEAQDLSIQQLRFLATLGTSNTNSLFFAGDLGQRIFQPAFSWKQLGVDIRGRSSTLRINYRTSHQIRGVADRLLEDSIADVDGNEERREAQSVFNGPPPSIRISDSVAAERDLVAAWLRERLDAGVAPGEIGVFVRSDEQVARARAAADAAGLPYRILDDRVATVSGSASIGTMHLAKGLEFRSVVVMACDDEIMPLQSRIDAIGDDADLEEVYKTERHLLYVACTRPRDHLLIAAVRPASEFLGDLEA